MKRKICILLLSVITSAVSLSAQVKHYLGSWAELSENSMITKISGADIEQQQLLSLGASASLGGGYELNARHFLLNIGLQFSVSHSAFSLPDIQKSLLDVTDDEGDKMDYIYRQTNRHDSYTNLSLQLPLLVGTQVRNFYFLAGVKLGISVYGSTIIKTNISSAGDYEKFIDEFVSMPEHLYYDATAFTRYSRVSFQPSLSPHLEIGYVFGSFSSEKGFDVPKTKNIYRLALFFDYGVLNLMKNGNKPILAVPGIMDSEDIDAQIEINDFLSSDFRQGNVNDFCIGLKFTAIFPLKEHKPCIICR